MIQRATNGGAIQFLPKFPAVGRPAFLRGLAPSPYFVVSLIFLALGCALAWLVLVLATQPPTIKREPLTFAEVVGPQHCRGAELVWECMVE